MINENVPERTIIARINNVDFFIFSVLIYANMQLLRKLTKQCCKLFLRVYINLYI